MRFHSFSFVAASILVLAFCTISISARGTVSAADSAVPRLPWLHEGLVLTYTWYAAVAPGNGSYYEEDDHGDMILHSTGQRYSRTMQTGTSGSGWTQITVAGIDGDKVVLESSSYANAGSLGKNAPVPQGTSSSVAALMDPGDYWMDPAKLASLHTAPAEHVLVSRVAWKAGDNTVDGIRVQVVNGSNLLRSHLRREKRTVRPRRQFFARRGAEASRPRRLRSRQHYHHAQRFRQLARRHHPVGQRTNTRLGREHPRAPLSRLDNVSRSAADGPERAHARHGSHSSRPQLGAILGDFNSTYTRRARYSALEIRTGIRPQ